MLDIQLTPFPEIKTSQLVWRELDESDAPVLLMQQSEPRIGRYLNREPDATLAQTRALIKRIQSATDTRGVTWAMVRLSEEHTLPGTLGFWRITPAHHRAEI